MIPRLATILIFVFCGTMTALLIRSVLHPEDSGLAAVAPNVPFDLFAARPEGSELDIWEANRIIGVCEFTPLTAGATLQTRREKARVRVVIHINLRQEIMRSSRLDLSGNFVLYSGGGIGGMALELVLPGSLPQLRLSISQADNAEWPRLKLMQGGGVLFEWNGRPPGEGATSPRDAAHNAMVELMLRSAGLSFDKLTAKTKEASGASMVRAGHLEAGGATFDGYLATVGGEDSRFRLYLANTGEILRIDTPFTGENELGLRFLAKSLRPAGAEAPDLSMYPLPPPVP